MLLWTLTFIEDKVYICTTAKSHWDTLQILDEYLEKCLKNSSGTSQNYLRKISFIFRVFGYTVLLGLGEIMSDGEFRIIFKYSLKKNIPDLSFGKLRRKLSTIYNK